MAARNSLRSCSLVANSPAKAWVTTRSSPRLAEVPVAFVILKPGQQASAEDLLGRLKGKIASYKIPKHVIFTQAYPMTSSGKIRKVELRAQAREILG